MENVTTFEKREMSFSALETFLIGRAHLVRPLFVTAFFISLVGVVLNYFCYKVTRNLPRQSTSTILMCYLAIWDTIAGLHDGIFQAGLKFLSIDMADRGAVLCKLLYYHSAASTINASWHLAVLALDRAVSLLFPIWHQNLNAKKHAKRISWSITLLIYACLLPNFYYFYIQNGICAFYVQGSKIGVAYASATTVILFVGAPFLVTFFSNVVFVYKLWLTKTQPVGKRIKNNKVKFGKRSRKSEAKKEVEANKRDQKDLERNQCKNCSHHFLKNQN